jgi:hypothetical protein
LVSGSNLLSRLVRNGFHALGIAQEGALLAAVPGAILRHSSTDREFQLSHRITRGTRPLHICVTPEGLAFWGEYFDNAERNEVHIYASSDHGASWHIAYTFPRGSIRHVHNIVYDPWRKCLWIATGDEDAECQILQASSSLDHVTPALRGSQQARAAALVPTATGLFFSSDTPLEKNYVYFLEDSGRLNRVAELASSSIYGCAVGERLFFSTMVEPSRVNPERSAILYGGSAHSSWEEVQSWEKDSWHPRLFQYGNVMMPDGLNQTDILAITTIALRGADMKTFLWCVEDRE